jgi:hypothetical protein
MYRGLDTEEDLDRSHSEVTSSSSEDLKVRIEKLDLLGTKVRSDQVRGDEEELRRKRTLISHEGREEEERGSSAVLGSCPSPQRDGDLRH